VMMRLSGVLTVEEIYIVIRVLKRVGTPSLWRLLMDRS